MASSTSNSSSSSRQQRAAEPPAPGTGGGGSGSETTAPEPAIKTQPVEGESGDVPAPRFGHTATLVGDKRIILFGGATGDTGRYTITADTYALDLETRNWKKLVPEQTGAQPPSARAAHAAACVDQYQLVIYGGATGGSVCAAIYYFPLSSRRT